MSEERGTKRESSQQAQNTPHQAKSTEEGDSQEHNQDEDIPSFKIHSKHLLPDTLNAYQLPWEWDERDPEYILVKRWLSEEFRDDLFRHTRNIRDETPIPTLRTTSEKSGTVDEWREEYSSDISYEAPSSQFYREESGIFERQIIPLSDSLSFDVNLRNPNVKRPIDELRPDPAHRKYSTQKIDIASSQIPGYGKVVLYRSEPKVDVDAQFSWIHTNTEIRSFDDFMRFASTVPDLAAEDRALVVSLMKRSHSKVEGLNQPNDVMRCIGLNSTIAGEITTEKCAIVLRFPYYSIHKMETAIQSRRSARNKVRTLLQYYYNFESTRKRDQEQVIRKVGLFPQDHIVHVPQMWAVIVNFRFIITGAPIALTDQGSLSLKIMDSPAQNSSSPSVICVVDPRQRVFFFPMELCKKFLTMRHNVMENCLNAKSKEPHYDQYDYRPSAKLKEPYDRHYRSQYKSHYRARHDSRPHAKFSEPCEPQPDFDLLTTDMKVIRAEDWPRIIKSPTSAIVRIHVQMLSSSPPKQQKTEKFPKEYDETSPLYTEPEDKRRFKPQEYPLPHSGGMRERIVQKPTDITSVIPDLYIPPAAAKPTPVSKEPTSHQKDISHETQNSGDKPRPFRKDSISHSLRGDSLVATDQSTVERKPRINTGFPPVFTWPVTKRSSEPSEDLEQQIQNTSIESPGPDSDKNAQSLHEETEAEPTYEEIIKHVSTHIDGELRGSTTEASSTIYKAAAEVSFFEVEKAIVKSLGASISFSMISDVGKEKGLSGLPPWKTDLKEVVNTLCRLFNFFVPLAYPCVIGDKFWGAIHDLITTIPQICDKSRMHELTKKNHPRMSTAFYVVDIRGEQHADLRDETDLALLTKDFTDCDDCDRAREYSKKSDAWDHLFKHHLNASSEQRILVSSRSKWVMDHGEYLTFICRQDGQEVLSKLESYTSSLEEMAFQIQHGVSENGKLDRDTYRIPSSLVDTFQNFVMMVVTSAHAVKSSYQIREKKMHSGQVSTFLTPSVTDKVESFAMEAEVAMETAIRDVILMTFTNEESDVVTYEAVSPSMVIALVMGDIICRDSQGNPVNLIDTYERYTQVLQFKAGQRPNRRLMQEIYIVREELLMIEKIAKEQRRIFRDYCDVLNPDTFRMVTDLRIASFELEKRWLNKAIDGIYGDLELITTLLDRLESIATQTRNGVEVRQEDQGKAILVFTIMTVVFMPLSFVTGYFGMNTEDIRDMGSSQALFWTVSIPFTVVIISAVLLVAFQADRLREAFDNLLSHDDVPVARPINNPPTKKEAPQREKELELPHSAVSSGKRWFARRGAANWRDASQDSSFA